MALNSVMLDSNRKPIPLPHEITTFKNEGGVKLKFPEDSKEAKGSLWLTEERLIFVSSPGSFFDSLTVPLSHILSTNFEQPALRSNYLRLQIRPSGPEEQSKLRQDTVVEIRFTDKPLFEFVALLDKMREKASFMKKKTEDVDEDLPSYTSPGESSTVSMMGGVPVDNPPTYD